MKRGGYLKRRTPLKRGGRLRTVSLSKQEENRLYLTVDKTEYLAEHPYCEACAVIHRFFANSLSTPRRSVDIHHKMRRGIYLRVRKFFMAVCRRCHDYIEANKKWARSVGFILYK